ncbi:sphingosine kinase 1-like [Electrophorus electricus]|uniref:sphingosine kinase 1-like n=1 Tax=Electrophorus electricus TaxID=8005 RepID=UPI0015D0BCFF|nr:sphingosine kinase 1-like [Electrophorus electricus]
MEHVKTDPEAPLGNGMCPVAMYGEFAFRHNRKSRYALSLTERDLAVQKLPAVQAARGRVVFNLRDCVGCRAYGADDHADVGAYFSAYFYPFRKRWASPGVARQRVEQCFRVASTQDPHGNLDEARKWARAISDGSVCNRPQKTGLCAEVRRPCTFLVLLNPQSGKGQAHTLFTRHVQGILQEAGILYTLIITECQNHARELVRETDLSQWDALVIMSGDGLLFEVVNGLMEREDWEEAIKTPLGILPGGSGNALAASIHHYAGLQPVTSEELLVSCGFTLCKGLVSRLDLSSVRTASGQRMFSFLSLAWGFVADVDIESEKYRRVGAARFTLGTLVRLASLRVYRGKLAYLPAQDPRGPSSTSAQGPSPQACPATHRDLPAWNRPFRNSCNSNNTPNPKRTDVPPAPERGPPDSLLAPLDSPVPAHWTVVTDEDFVLVLAVYQSHLAEDLIAAPASQLEDGVMHLIYVKAGISRTALLRLFLAMEKGTHLGTGCPHVEYVKVRALRLEPHSPKGTITVDGELVEYGPVQAQIHGSLARLIAG